MPTRRIRASRVHASPRLRAQGSSSDVPERRRPDLGDVSQVASVRPTVEDSQALDAFGVFVAWRADEAHWAMPGRWMLVAGQPDGTWADDADGSRGRGLTLNG